MVFCCFGCVLKKVSGCWFLALLEVAAAIKISDQSNLTKIRFLVGVQKGRFGPRKPNIVIDFPSCSARNWVVFCCFGCVLKKVSGCWFLALLEVAAAIKISDQSNLTKIRFLLDKIGFLVGFQKGRFGPRKPIIVIDFALCSARN